VYVPNFEGVDLTLGGRNLIGREILPAQSDYNRSMPTLDVLSIPGAGREVFMRAGYRF